MTALRPDQITFARGQFLMGASVSEVMGTILDSDQLHMVAQVRKRRANHLPIPLSWPGYERELSQIQNPPRSAGQLFLRRVDRFRHEPVWMRPVLVLA